MDWIRMKSGDLSAFERLYRAHVQPMMRYGLKITDDPALVQDCIQDLFEETWKNRQHLSDTPYPKYYLLRALRNKLSKALSKQSFVRNGELNLASGELLSGYVELEIVARETENLNRETLRHLLDELPRRQQEAIHLRFYHNVSYENIAEMMDMNYQSVLNLVQRALKALRKGFSVKVPRR
ncbi:RNA polymerase sigma factor [Chitinophaga rhizosphaerae]|uniref:RNA polymerase sigma factor n=1 Tax=Chitinophaga rhizosphaerae TaxID=1864947 RepID=UPI000F801E29|nr:sigma-70 family RNA polymerase sigma factor [Chitinophaga rhizosphaerae]